MSQYIVHKLMGRLVWLYLLTFKCTEHGILIVMTKGHSWFIYSLCPTFSCYFREHSFLEKKPTKFTGKSLMFYAHSLIHQSSQVQYVFWLHEKAMRTLEPTRSRPACAMQQYPFLKKIFLFYVHWCLPTCLCDMDIVCLCVGTRAHGTRVTESWPASVNASNWTFVLWMNRRCS